MDMQLDDCKYLAWWSCIRAPIVSPMLRAASSNGVGSISSVTVSSDSQVALLMVNCRVVGSRGPVHYECTS